VKEAALEKKVVDYARSVGCWAIKLSSPARRGLPDRMVLGPQGGVVFLELKATGKKPTKLQQEALEKLRAMGHVAVWSDDFEVCKILVDSLRPA
jgi:Holliday junction resolvase